MIQTRSITDDEFKEVIKVLFKWKLRKLVKVFGKLLFGDLKQHILNFWIAWGVEKPTN